MTNTDTVERRKNREPSALALRLERLIRERGTTARALSMQAGLTPDTIRNIYRGQSTSPRGKTLSALADALGVPVACLLGDSGSVGTADAIFASSPPPHPPPRLTREMSEAHFREQPHASPPYHMPAVQPEAGMLEIGELDVRSHGGQPASEETWRRLHTWLLPVDLVSSRMGPGSALAVIRVPDDALAPDYRLDDRVLVDLGARVPSPPGVFLVSDGYSYSLARCELVRGAPGSVRVHQRGSEAVMPLAEAGIAGRILGRWCWT